LTGHVRSDKGIRRWSKKTRGINIKIIIKINREK
jgi:hypothetical protein